MCAALSLSRVHSAAVTWISCCCLLNLLTFDEFERVMRAVKKCVGNTVKRFEIMNMYCNILIMLIHCICVSV